MTAINEVKISHAIKNMIKKINISNKFDNIIGNWNKISKSNRNPSIKFNFRLLINNFFILSNIAIKTYILYNKLIKI